MRKLLIANRGEIARRIIRSARSRGIATVAVYSEIDAGSLHVAEADESFAIGPASARQSYLDAATVIKAAAKSGADAVHPGYGFLSENADFANAVLSAGMVWVGPSPDTIRAMGDKDRARRIAVSAGVPVVPGSPRIEARTNANLDTLARQVGFPLLVKASAGGGGIGMRRVDTFERLSDTVGATTSMAEKAFGDGTVFLERFVPRARHVEIQVFGFGNGEAVHLFERDCSLQRRFQKVIEESPAPRLAEDTRMAMAAAAVALCRTTGYAGAGTVEFILDVETGEFFFLEMNTRIQVEHPVTEMVTGRDLVGMQLDFARGALPSLEQSSLESDGHAIQCRLYAENPAKSFLPSPGRLDRFTMPTAGANLRVDCGYREGDLVSPHYDPMIAKIIAHGRDRDAACDRAISALKEIEVTGIATNRDFLVACLQRPAFRAGDVHTGFIDEEKKGLLAAVAAAA